MYMVRIFSHSNYNVLCFTILSSFMKYHLLIFVLMSVVLVFCSGNSFVCQWIQAYSSFRVCGLTLVSLTNSEFCAGNRYKSISILLPGAIQFAKYSKAENWSNKGNLYYSWVHKQRMLHHNIETLAHPCSLML